MGKVWLASFQLAEWNSQRNIISQPNEFTRKTRFIGMFDEIFTSLVLFNFGGSWQGEYPNLRIPESIARRF